MHKRIAFIVCFFIFVVTSVKATELDIKKNGEGSVNSVSLQENAGTSIKQGNSMQVNTTIDAKASTGKNTVSGNTNGNSTIITGNATVSTNVTNTGNTNNVDSKSTPKPGHTIKPTDINKPTATPQPGSSSNSSGGGSSSNNSASNSENQTGGIGGAEVMGLAATSSTDSLSLLSSIAGFICLVIGSALVSRRDQTR